MLITDTLQAISFLSEIKLENRIVANFKLLQIPFKNGYFLSTYNNLLHC